MDSIVDASLPFPEADLRDHAPRPAGAMLGGLVFLARTIDKAKAKINGTLGVYKIGPGISIYLLDHLGITEHDFVEAVRAHRDDDAIADWVHAHSDPATYATINEALSQRKVRAEIREDMGRVYPIIAARPDLDNWFQIFDIDDAAEFARGRKD
jgi:hypothetical protein